LKDFWKGPSLPNCCPWNL